MASTALLRFSNIAVMAVVAHIVSPHDFGVFAVALTVYTIVANINELGVASCILRRDLDLDLIAPTVATIALTSSAVLAGAMIVFAEPLAAALGAANAAGPLRVMAIAVLFAGVFAVPGTYLGREFRQDKVFWANLVGFAVSTPVLITLSFIGSGAMAFAWSRVVGLTATGCMFVLYAPRKSRLGFVRSMVAPLLGFGLPLAGANLLNYTLLNVDYVFIGRLLGAASLGAYVLAFNVASWSTSLLSAVINNVSLPAFSQIREDPGRLHDSIQKAVRIVALIAFPMAGVTFALARPLVVVLYGPKWSSAVTVLSVLVFYGAISIECVLFANVLSGVGRSRLLFLLQVLWLGTLVPAIVIGVRRQGIVGAGMAHLVVIGAIVLPAYLIAIKKVTGVSLTRLAAAIAPPLAITIAVTLTARFSSALPGGPLGQLIVGGVASGALYIVLAGPFLAPALWNRQIPGLSGISYLTRMDIRSHGRQRRHRRSRLALRQPQNEARSAAADPQSAAADPRSAGANR